ncbi:MAG: hypothetical protein U1F68_06085 [Gammaproteobacteria bacterium]
MEQRDHAEALAAVALLECPEALLFGTPAPRVAFIVSAARFVPIAQTLRIDSTVRVSIARPPTAAFTEILPFAYDFAAAFLLTSRTL